MAAQYPKTKKKVNVTGMPMPFELRYVMENADELSEVDKIFNNYSTHGWFITVGSNKDQSGAMYELTRGQCIKNKMQDNYVGVTNLAVSEKGRYEYSPINMHGERNITREDKLKELYQNISNENLVDKAYQMVSSTTYYELPHDTSWGCSINNDITVKSCIMDNTNQKIYFAYGEMLAGCNQFLEYDLATQDVSVYKEKQTIPDEDYLKNRLVFKKWYRENCSEKKKLEKEDYLQMIEKVNQLELQPAYKYNLLSRCYINLENKEKANEYASKYIAEMPTFGSAYMTQFTISRLSKDYEKAIQSIQEMLEKAHNTPSDYFWAKRQMILMYDKLQAQSPKEEYVNKIKVLNEELKELCKPFFLRNG
ncbi:tetratricopeptide repeat protein [Marinifilum fragile]|uniref:tetratricopeptide repeat protein n=1 Tax=Marinifilum fragile TaxID=570161 RepID=UPI00155DD4F3|nr:hypothetical protein [Marinifilum fragile]